MRFVKRAAPTVVAPPAQPTDISRFTPIVIQRVSTLWTFTTRLLDGRLRGNFSIVTWMKPRWRSFNRFYFFTHNKSQFLIFLCVLTLLQEIVSVGCSVGLSIRLSVRPPRLCWNCANWTIPAAPHAFPQSFPFSRSFILAFIHSSIHSQRSSIYNIH